MLALPRGPTGALNVRRLDALTIKRIASVIKKLEIYWVFMTQLHWPPPSQVRFAAGGTRLSPRCLQIFGFSALRYYRYLHFTCVLSREIEPELMG
jgi:hypothetical protein